MLNKNHPLQSKSEVILRNIVVTAMIIYFIVFLIIPIGTAFVGSFHEWNPLSGTFRLLGLDNYRKIFTDNLFWKSLSNTIVFSFVVIIFRVGFGLAIALAIYSKMIKHKSFFRMLYYMPVVTPMVAVAYVWKFMYHPQIGTMNQIFGLNVNWLMNSKMALPAIMLMTIWKDFGYAVVMFMAGLYSLPKDAMEAADVDGASPWQKFRYITIPLLKPMILFVVITSIIAYIQAYVQVLILTEGGPGTSTFLSSYIIFDEAFVKYNFGFASAMSFIMFVVTAVLTWLSFRVTRSKG
ncbi:carbohydrate ABC transporter permease [Anaerosacchariphilus polymeriproducens]|uniref:Sugar ABC transporter permease n=1 Tax=Anaerosacchariphilus polymeriproducens TaxID=1812858 RepID=A0A371AZJ9_9FIRM|nr:sugar ABC transporter permease [Anaerosacchariphilus polymeriproducens]RDU25024.1 sugar ABC transporter permease [Anaerosacchariphilus polymeriproducens]